ncbi:MAG: pitrilysin family protein [Xenococcaceae cyanobacterium MO_207.B15]|nr:pitrilysin family protein [Xenococcaceae cyanobacterium MO_207.B15]
MTSSLNQEPKQQNIHRTILPNGIILLVVENQAADLVACRCFLSQAGLRVESRKQAGISNLVASVITKGTKNLSALEIAEQVESIGASLGADAGSDYFLMNLKTIAADFAEMLKLLSEIIRYPSFPVSEIDLEKKLAIQSIRSQQEQPFNVAFKQLREMIYPDHPYGVSVLGTEATVAELTQEDLLNYHQSYFRPDNLIISISGRITQETAISLVQEVFGDWHIPSNTLLEESPTVLNSTPTEKIIIQDTQQSIVMLGYLGAEVKHEDYPVLKLISTYLGNGLSSRLFVELREKRGLAYDVSAFYPTRLEAAPFITYMGTAPENTEIAIAGLREEVLRLTKEKLTDIELQGAKNKLLGQYALGKQTNSEIAQIFGWYETLGLGIKFDSFFQNAIAEVTSDRIMEVANRYLTNPYISIVKPPTKNLDKVKHI